MADHHPSSPGRTVGLHEPQGHTDHDLPPPTYPIPIPPEKLAKALKLYISYGLEEGLEIKQASTDQYYLDVRPPSNAHKTTTVSGSSGISSLPSSDEVFDGKKVKPRSRKRLSPKSRAKAALIRCLGSCSVCRSRRVRCPLEHHDIENLERERLKSKTKPSERVARRLRCHFNARYPHRFCATRSTGNKYHVCSKEGYLTISHLKQHHKSTHTVSRCPRCGELFDNDTLRDTHARGDISCEMLLPEQWPGTGQAENINETIRQRISSILTSRGYYMLLQATKSAIDLWVDANIVEYAGTSALHKDRLELKNWYLIWLALFPDIPAPTHPFYDGPSEAPVEDEIFIEVFQSTVDARIARGQMMAVSAEAMIQILDCLRETQRTRLQTSQSITPEIAAPKVEAKTEQKRPRSPPTPSGSEPPTKRANFKLEDRSIPRQEAQDFVNPHPFESSRLTETPSRFSSIPGFGNIQEQTLPFSTGAAPSDSFDFMSSGYPDPDSQPWLGWIDYPPGPHYLLGPDFIPD